MNVGSVVAAFLAGACAACCNAQEFPTRPIRFISPYPPGGAVDTLARIVGERLAARLGQQVVVDNRPGANGAIAMNIVAAAPADGYTMTAVAQAFMTFQSVYRDFRYDVRKDYTPLVLGATFPMVMLVHPSVPARTVKELIDLARAKPGAVNYGSNGGIGSSGHIYSEHFNQRAGIQITHVPYKGGGPMNVDLIGGQVQTAFAHITSALPHVKSGRVRPLATTATVRLPVLPEVPTMTEIGFPEFNTGEVWGVLGPARVPAAIARKLNAEMAAIIRAPALHDRLVGEGAQVRAGDADEFRAFIASEVPRLAEVLERAGVKKGDF